MWEGGCGRKEVGGRRWEGGGGREEGSRREGRVWKKGEREGSGIGRGKGGPRRRTGDDPKWCVNRCRGGGRLREEGKYLW